MPSVHILISFKIIYIGDYLIHTYFHGLVISVHINDYKLYEIVPEHG